MKTEFKAKFLQNISKKRSEEGFTLIELLVVIIIIGILSAIALPSFLNQANKAKQTEAKQYVASINKGQQAYYVENASFGGSVEILGIGIKTQTANYSYSINPTPGASGVGVVAGQMTGVKGLKAYAGGVGLVDVADGKSTNSVICETPTADTAPTATTFGASGASCAGGMTALVK